MDGVLAQAAHTSQPMTWSELRARASDSVARSQWLLDRALAALDAANNVVLDAVIATELPTPDGLCAMLDEHGVGIPHEVLSRFQGYMSPSPTRANESTTIAGVRWQP